MTSFDLDLSKYDLGWSDEGVEYAFQPEKGINQGVVDQISWWKGEPRWMTQLRQRALQLRALVRGQRGRPVVGARSEAPPGGAGASGAAPARTPPGASLALAPSSSVT